VVHERANYHASKAKRQAQARNGIARSKSSRDASLTREIAPHKDARRAFISPPQRVAGAIDLPALA